MTMALSGCAQVPTPPQPEKTTAVERANSLAKCINEAGFSVVVTWQNAVELSEPLPISQKSDYNTVVDSCLQSTRANIFEYDEQDQRNLYALELEQRSCLLEQSQPVSDPPSEQTYLDAFNTKDRWFAMSAFLQTNPPRDVYEQVLMTCKSPSWSY